MIIKRYHPFGWAAQVSDDKADTGVQLAGMPFHLGNNTALLIPRSGLIAEAGVIAPLMVRRTANGSGQQMSDTFLKNSVRLEADGVEKTFYFQELVDVRYGKGGIPSEVTTQVPFPLTRNNRFQNPTPAVGAVDIAGAERTPFQIAKLVEQE